MVAIPRIYYLALKVILGVTKIFIVAIDFTTKEIILEKLILVIRKLKL